ncbi:hypothetical protein NQ318_021894 [Aromia moschata]|uniref:UDP-glucuronosyltransferase n=1 Tax=Aromia moschata TaxID=1265417 RepID=A0AAV8Z844_9CUCU|nr:hypothetical protein NQ318_021894 [Aromia moschata]
MCIALVYVFIMFASPSTGANILVISPTPVYSHQTAFFELWTELSLRGHNVTLITTNPMNDPKLRNLTEIDMKHTYDLMKGVTSIINHMTSIWNTYEYINTYMLAIFNEQISQPRFQELVEGRGNFNLVLVNSQHPQLLIFGKIYNCPTILFSSFYLYGYNHEAQGNPSHTIAHIGYARLISTVFYLRDWYSVTYELLPTRDRALNKYFNTSVTVRELLRDVDLVFLNTNPAIHGARAFGPTTIEIGYERKPTSIKLEKGLKQFLDNANDGFIYFSLGSNIKSKDITRSLLKTIIEAIKEIPYTFLYKYEGDYLDDKPDNVRLVKWAPQCQILRHPNIKLFVTQGGFQSMEEAIYSAVPMVVIPFFADQEHNGRLMESKGIAKVVNRKSLTKEELKGAIKEVLRNSSYRETIERLRQLARDVPMTGLEKAIWWTEYVIRHKGAKHLRNPVADLPLYQYYLLDVIGVLLSIVVVFVAIAYFITKMFFMMVVMRLRIQMDTVDKKYL